MEVLWVTRLVPYPPFYGGDALYSSHLIEGLADQGVAVTVLCSGAPGNPPPTIPGTEWNVVPWEHRSRAGSLSRLAPSIVYRSSTPAVQKAMQKLAERRWDAIIIDNLAMAGAIGGSGSTPNGRSPLVYLSHNHEGSVRGALAASMPLLSLRRLGLEMDAIKADRLERALVRQAQLVTVTAPGDLEHFRSDNPKTRYLVLTPGFSGDTRERRMIDATTPRRILLLGTYNWIAKQLNLVRFLEASRSRLDAAGVGIDVVGSMPVGLANRLKAKYPSVTVTNAVEDLGSFFERARVGVVAEAVGGGFKLKVLDYVFNRVPIAALSGTVDGVPLRPGPEYLESLTLDAMVTGIIGLVDDLPRLNAMQAGAFTACEGRFDWRDRGRDLAAAISSMSGEQALT